MDSAIGDIPRRDPAARGASPKAFPRSKAPRASCFVERGYDATRPQDIAREAGLGHGTFYLHYPDKRACFLAFVEEARQEMDVLSARARAARIRAWSRRSRATLNAIYDYSDSHPGVLRAAMTDAAVIDAGGRPGRAADGALGRGMGRDHSRRGGAGQGLQFLSMPGSSARQWRGLAPGRAWNAPAAGNAAWRWRTISPGSWCGRCGRTERRRQLAPWQGLNFTNRRLSTCT